MGSTHSILFPSVLSRQMASSHMRMLFVTLLVSAVSTTVEAGRVRIARVQSHAAAQIGDNCKGEGMLDFRSVGNCTWPSITEEEGDAFKLHLKCYSKTDTANHAENGEDGICLVARHQRCHQKSLCDEASGGCRGGMVCRLFRYEVIENAYFNDLRTESFCVDPTDKDDAKLKFVGANGYSPEGACDQHGQFRKL